MLGTGNPQAVMDVSLRFLFIEGRKVVADGNPLPDCLVAPVHQHTVEFTLPDKKNIDQLSVVVVDVGKHLGFRQAAHARADGLHR